MMDPVTVGALSVVAIFVLILAGFHVGIALGAMSFAGVYLITGKFRVAASILQTTAFNGVNDYIFAVIPLFVVMGLFATQAGATRDLFDAAESLMRRVRGGIGVATVMANAIFAAITGVSVASAAVFSKLAIPEMDRLGYNRRFGLGIVASSALLGMLIPPSILMIVYGVITEESIGRLFAAGIGPGLLVAGTLSATILLMVRLNPALAGQEGHVAARAREPRLSIILKIWPIFALIGLVLGGIYGGLFTPTEAGAIGALGALVLMVLRGRFSGGGVVEILLETGKACASIFFLLITAQMYSRMLTLSRLPEALTEWASALEVPGIVIILSFILVLLILGCIIDSVSIMLLTMPIMVPLAATFGYDKVWFGMIAILTIEIGLLTPPFGMVIFAMKASLPADVKIEDIFIGVAPFFAMLFVALALIVIFPQISLFFPKLLLG
ncbi:TRAP transporter large permease [Aquabacter spiritensis]|uniref:TRAP transporter large permease protein n=1 Tax=Aquabacter spiritensis TaxID=933073 RepID=A0A4R3LVB5_9HYPH|nr:TRAP transporter large permease [Aquabacter spiritensis]TCT03986.1 tripartite ATP-independent transporter DctM subunit [Aquabacter spiritensis]